MGDPSRPRDRNKSNDAQAWALMAVWRTAVDRAVAGYDVHYSDAVLIADSVRDRVEEARMTDPDYLTDPLDQGKYIDIAVENFLRLRSRRNQRADQRQAELVEEIRDELDQRFDWRTMGEDPPETDERYVIYWAFLDRLGKQAFAVWGLYYGIPPQTRREIAEILGISPETVKTHLKRGVAKLDAMRAAYQRARGGTT